MIWDFFRTKKITTPEKRDYAANWILNVTNQGKVVNITQKTGLTIGAVFACIDVIADTFSLISPKIIEETQNGKIPRYDHDQYRLIAVEPNPNYSAKEFEKLQIVQKLLYGNSYVEIIRNGTGRPIRYDLLKSDCMTVEMVNDERVYIYQEPSKDKRVIRQENILHYSDISLDGLAAKSRLINSKDIFQENKNLHSYTNEMYSNGVFLTGYIKATDDNKVTDEARKFIAENFERTFSDTSGRVGVLPEGFEYIPYNHAVPMGTATLIEAKKLSVADIYRMFRVPLSFAGIDATADNKGDAEYNRFLTTTIAPIAIMRQAEMNRKIFRPSEKNLSVYYELKGLYRVDMSARYQAYQVALNAGFMNKDEVRNLEGMNPIAGGLGKEYYQPLNTIPLSQAADYFEKIIQDANSSKAVN